MTDTSNSTLNPSEDKPPIRVLVVDDSAFMRFIISDVVNKTSDIKVVGVARDGKEALSYVPVLKPDVIILDVEMPVMDGLSTLKEIMSRFPRPVIMFSSLTTEGASTTIQALTLGAFDFIAKPENKANVAAVMDDAILKIRQAAKKTTRAIREKPLTSQVQSSSSLSTYPTAVFAPTPLSQKVTRPLQPTDRVVVIGSSTGGPRALHTVIPALKSELPAAYLVVQHMPVGFTKSLAERLDSLSSVKVKEAEAGDSLEVGKVLFAPGGYHMVLDSSQKIVLNQNPTVHGVRPSVDVTMLSVAQQFKSATIGVILTGMGKDGTNGCALIHSQGGKVIAEDESTCVVWGMPRSVYEAGYADEVIRLPDIPQAIEHYLTTTNR